MTLKTAIDDAGAAAGELTMTLPAGGARTVSAAELESTENRSDAVRAALQGELGVGVGKWQLLLAAETPVVAMSLLKSPGGHLSNLSTAPYRSVAGGNAIRQMAEDIEAGTAIGAPVTADLGGEGELVHLLDGADAASFTVDSGTGQLRTAAGVNYNFEAKDRYAVAVVAEDGEGGDASIAVTVKVTDEDGEAPHTPAEPLLTGATTTSLTIAWTPPTNNGPPITNYTVEYRVLNTGNFAEWPHTGTTTSATIENLDKSTIYQAVVQATNDEGTSLRSTRLLATTRAPHSTEPVHARDSSHEEQQGGASGIPVTLIDSGFGPTLDGGRVTATFMNTVADADEVLYTQTDGGRTYRLEGLLFTGYSDFLVSGYMRHALAHEDGIVWTASDQTTHYRSGDFDWFIEDGRPFKKTARAFANWMNDRNVLFVSSLENITAQSVGSSLEAVYCDDFHAGGFDGRGWIPLCGEIDDYIAHSGDGKQNTVFAGAIYRGVAGAAIRDGGVFAANSIFVESPNDSTSHATAVLAAYASAMKAANPTWGAAKQRTELMRVARLQEYDFITGSTNDVGSLVTERRTIRVILPAFAPGTGNRLLTAQQTITVTVTDLAE